MRIILFCPPATVVNGGIKQIFALGDTLHKQGFDVVVFEEHARRPAWFTSTVPVAGQGIFTPRADEVLVLPEDQPQILELFKTWPQRKVVYSQNHFYGSLSLQNVGSFADYGITHGLCCSLTTLEHMKRRHPKILAHPVLNGIDTGRFTPQEKEQTILYMPRKRPVEAAFIKDLFRFTHPDMASWKWQEIDNRTEAQTAALMGRAGVFLALSRLESLGLSPLEAMASGCIVAGFTGIGGREYARSENGFWVAEDDFPACVEALRQAVMLAQKELDTPERQAYHAACRAVLETYTPETFARQARDAFTRIMA